MGLLRVEKRDAAVIVYVIVPRVDMMMYRKFRDEMQQLIDESPERVVVDLEATSSLDSSAVGVLKKSLDETAKRGGRLILCNVSKPIISILRLAHLEDSFTIVETLDEALMWGKGPG